MSVYSQSPAVQLKLSFSKTFNGHSTVETTLHKLHKFLAAQFNWPVSFNIQNVTQSEN